MDHDGGYTPPPSAKELRTARRQPVLCMPHQTKKNRSAVVLVLTYTPVGWPLS